MSHETDLQRAFAATDYRVELDGQTVTLRIGRSTPAPLAAWIATRNGATPAWLITAHNPRGERIDETRNRAREAALTQSLERPGLRCLPALNRDPSGRWPDERGWLIAGLEEDWARNLARRFDQAAIVVVAADRVTLLWTAD